MRRDRAAICAEQQGRFPEFHARLMESDLWQADTNWAREADLAGVADIGIFEACLNSAAVTSRLEADGRFAEAFGVTSTPTLVNRRGIHVGAVSIDILAGLAKD